MERTLLYFEEYKVPSLRLAGILSVEAFAVRVHHFPDGESLVRLPERLPRHVMICRSLFTPNEKLVELMFAAKAVREVGVERLTLIAPYLCYMRQDKAFHAGEAVSQRIIGDFLSGLFDCVVTVDAHLHRVHSLEAVMPGIQAVNLSAAGPVSEYLVSAQERPLLLGPDEESLQWVRQIADRCFLDYDVCRKVRKGDRDVEVLLPDLNDSVKRVVIVDDILSTGRTVAAVAGLLRKRGVPRVDCLVTHAVFAEGARYLLEKDGVNDIISTDSIPHETNKIQLAPVIADFLNR